MHQTAYPLCVPSRDPCMKRVQPVFQVMPIHTVQGLQVVFGGPGTFLAGKGFGKAVSEIGVYHPSVRTEVLLPQGHLH
jgi:hypothetical protein